MNEQDPINMNGSRYILLVVVRGVEQSGPRAPNIFLPNKLVLTFLRATFGTDNI